jgi:hypothetical protein
MNLEEEIKKNLKGPSSSLAAEIQSNLKSGATGGGWASERAIGNTQDFYKQQPQQPGPGIVRGLAEAFADPFARYGRFVGSQLNVNTRTAREARETSSALQSQRVEGIARAGQKLRDPNVSNSEKIRLRRFLEQITKDASASSVEINKAAEQLIDDTNLVKALASGAEIGLLASTGGTARLAGLGAKKTVVAGKGLTRTAPKLSQMSRGQLARAAGVLGAEGAAFGTAVGLREDDPTLKSVGLSALAGGALGAAIPVAGAGLGKGLTASKIGFNKLDSASAKTIGNIIDKTLSTTVGQKIAVTFNAARRKLQASSAPIYQDVENLVRTNSITRGEANAIRAQIQTARTNSKSMAIAWMERDPDSLILAAPINGQTMDTAIGDDVSRYINARQELQAIRIDKVNNPARRAELEEIVANLESPDFVRKYDAAVRINQKLTDMLVDAGIVSDRDRSFWRSRNEEYIRIQRVIEGLSERRQTGTGSAPVSISSTRAGQRIVGSTREAQNAFFTQIERAQNVFSEINRQKAVNAYIEALERGGRLGEQLRSADDVLARQSLQESLRMSRPLKLAYERIVKSQSKYIRKIQAEINSLKGQANKELSRKLTQATKNQLVPEDRVTNIAAVIEQIMTTDIKTLRSLNKKWAVRDKRLSQAMQELFDLRTQLEGVKAQRKLEYQEILQRADQAAKGRPTISRFKNGVEEKFLTTPEIEAAAKNFNAQYMGTFGKIISAPVRFMQTTITGGLNPAWNAIAIPRDFIEGLVLSERARVTHHPANIVGHISDMLGGKDKELFQRFMSSEKGASSVIDLTRSAKTNAQVLRKLSRAQLPRTQRVAQVIKNPSDFYGAIQEASKWNEYASKYMNFRGTYNDLIDAGIPEEQAFQRALWNGRNATGNLLEIGDWTRALQAVYPYVNPAIQGGSSLARAFKNRPLATSAKVVLGVQMPAALATAWNLSDPRRAEIYLDITPSERERFNIVVLPGAEKSNGLWQVFKLPKAPGVGSFANPVEKMMVAMYGYDAQGFENFAQSMIKAFGSPIDPSSMSAATGSVIPFQLKTPIQTAANYNFYSGRQIVPDWLLQENPDEPYRQTYPNTSSTFNKIGKALNISPLFVQQFANDTIGEFGRNAIYLSDIAQDLAGVSEGGVGGRSPLTSITRGYYGAFGGVEQAKFRKELDQTITSKASLSRQITEAVKNNNISRANQLAEEYNKKVDGLLNLVQNRSQFVSASEAQQNYLQSLKFPMEGSRLKQTSINSRLKQ